METQQSIHIMAQAMKERGDINIAKYLWKLKKSKIFDTSINHIIIGRMYYGIYLLAKAQLLVKLNTEKEIMYKPKPYKNKKGEFIYKDVIWTKIADYHHRSHVANFRKGSQLALKRERFEYNHYVCDDKEVIQAFKDFLRIYKVLR